jgi:hypothetical protein
MVPALLRGWRILLAISMPVISSSIEMASAVRNP